MNDIEIVYANDLLVMVNKPSGLLSVPGRGPDKKDCVISRVQKDFPTARVVHRLDCATSGLMVIALDADSHRELSRQFHDREVSKAYTAVLCGELKETAGEVNQPLMTDWPNRPRQMISPDGKPAKTRFKVLAFGENQTRVELVPITGRSHQLRVHMQYLGCPILGDQLYASPEGAAASGRLLLHAHFLSIKHPGSNERLEFSNDAPF